MSVAGNPADPERPDPQALLEAIEKSAERQKRGRLKVFFGAAPGVGKTYAMLRFGIDEQSKGREVVVGVVETHQRSDTEALASALPHLPLMPVDGSQTLREFDLDAALARRPKLLLLDELAHSNARGARHSKRWQDLEELLSAGIDVATTINVQHLESVNDVVFAITGVRVRETVPDRVVTDAEEITLIDISEEDLLQRLRENKVYLGARGARAMQHFFRKSNLMALRQLAMRVAADRMDSELQIFRTTHPEDTRDGGRLRETVLVAIGADAESEQLIRAGYRLSQALHCPWLVVHVDTPRGLWQRPQYQAWLWSHFHLAERMGAETVRITGTNVATEILAYASTRQVTRIVVGSWSGLRHFWQQLRSPLRQLLRHSPAIDIVICPLHSPENHTSANPAYLKAVPRRELRLRASRPLLISAAGGVVLTALGMLFSPWLGTAAFFLLALMGSVIAALRYGRWPAIVVIVSAQAAFFLFGQGKNLPDTMESLLLFLANLTVAILISQLVARSRDQALMARMRERRARNLYNLVQELSAQQDVNTVLSEAINQIHRSLGFHIRFWLPEPDGKLPLHRHPVDSSEEGDPARSRSGAVWVFQNQRPAGMGTDTLSSLPALLLPLCNGDQVLGVMEIGDLEIQRIPGEWLRYLETIARLIAAAMEAAAVLTLRTEAKLQLRMEQMQNTLLSAISHDLRTPLTAVLGTLSTLEDFREDISLEDQQVLIRNLRNDAQRMADTMERILRVASLLSQGTDLRREWVPLAEIIGMAQRQLAPSCRARDFQYQIASGLPLLHVDPGLIAQVLSNLLDNACRYSPAHTPIIIQAWMDAEIARVCVIDQGLGIPPGKEEQIFARFSQVKPRFGEGGSGLGLTIAKSIVEMHGGQIHASNQNMNPGARFCFTLPLDTPPPPPEEENEHGPAGSTVGGR